MTHPFDRLIGRRLPPGPDLEPIAATEELPILADMRALTAAVDLHHGSYRHVVPESRLGRLEGTITRGLREARAGNAVLFSTVAKLFAVQAAYSSNPAEQDRIRTRMRECIGEGLPALIGAELPPRSRVRALYDMALAYSSVLATSGGSAMTEEDRELLRRVYLQIEAGAEATSVARIHDPNIEGIPPYWSSFARAQAAMLDGDSHASLSNLLETRRLLRTIAVPAEAGGFRDLVTTSTRMAIQGLRGDPSAYSAELLRTSSLLDVLGYFYLVDHIELHGEEAISEAQQQLQRFGWTVNVILHRDPTTSVSQIVEMLHGIEGDNYDRLRERIRESLTEHPLSSEQREALGLASGLSAGEIADALMRASETIADHLHNHRESEPFRSFLARDADHRHIDATTALLRSRSELQEVLRVHLDLAEGAEATEIVRGLLEYGNLLPTLLSDLDEAVRNNPANEAFFRSLNYASQAMVNLPEHLAEFVNLAAYLSENDEHYAPAYAAYLQAVSRHAEIAPGISLPFTLRHRAEHAARRIGDFSLERIVNHLTTCESLTMIVGGSLLGHLGTGLFLQRAGTAGRWGWAVRGGQITLSGEIALGFGVGALTSVLGGGMHLLASPRPAGEEFLRILPGLAVGTVFSGLAIAGSSGLFRLARGRILPPGTPTVFGRIGTFLTAGGMMVGANYLTGGVVADHWDAPSSEAIAETFMMMAAWDLAAAGWRGLGNRAYWRFQIGPRLADQVTSHVGRMIERNPDLRGDRAFLENYLGIRLATGRSIAEIAVGLEGDMIPVLEGRGRSRRPSFITREELRLRAARQIRGVEDTAGYREFRDIFDNPDHPLHVGMRQARERLQEMIGGEADPVVYLRIERGPSDIERVSVIAKSRRPSARNPRDIILEVRRNGISNDEVNRYVPETDAAMRMALEAIQASVFSSSVSARSGGAASDPDAVATAELRPAAAVENSASPTAEPPPPGDPAPRASGESLASDLEPTPATGVRAVPPAPEGRVSGREDTRRASADEMRRARRSSRELDIEAESADPVPAPSDADIVVNRDQFFLQMQEMLLTHGEETIAVRGHLESDGSIRLEVIPESQHHSLTDRRNVFVMQFGRIVQEFEMNPSLHQAIEYYRSQLVPDGPARPRRRSPVPVSPRPAEPERESARPAGEPSERDVIALDDEVSFGDLGIGADGMPPAGGPASLEAPAVPRESAAIPPPIPPRPATAGSIESALREVTSGGARTVEPPRPETPPPEPLHEDSAPILLTRERERVRASSPTADGTRTAGLRPMESVNYAEISQRVLELFDELETVCRTVRPRPELFHVAVSESGEMHLISRDQYRAALARDTYGLFVLRRIRPSDRSGSEPRDVFYLEGEPMIPDSHTRLGLENYLTRWFGRNVDYDPTAGTR